MTGGLWSSSTLTSPGRCPSACRRPPARACARSATEPSSAPAAPRLLPRHGARRRWRSSPTVSRCCGCPRRDRRSGRACRRRRIRFAVHLGAYAHLQLQLQLQSQLHDHVLTSGPKRDLGDFSTCSANGRFQSGPVARPKECHPRLRAVSASSWISGAVVQPAEPFAGPGWPPENDCCRRRGPFRRRDRRSSFRIVRSFAAKSAMAAMGREQSLDSLPARRARSAGPSIASPPSSR